MLFFNVLLLCVIGTPVLAAVIPQGDLQIRSPRDGQLRSASRLERRIESDPIKNWLQKAGIGIQGTWYLSGEVSGIHRVFVYLITDYRLRIKLGRTELLSWVPPSGPQVFTTSLVSRES